MLFGAPLSRAVALRVQGLVGVVVPLECRMTVVCGRWSQLEERHLSVNEIFSRCRCLTLALSASFLALLAGPYNGEFFASFIRRSLPLRS